MFLYLFLAEVGADEADLLVHLAIFSGQGQKVPHKIHTTTSNSFPCSFRMEPRTLTLNGCVTLHADLMLSYIVKLHC